MNHAENRIAEPVTTFHEKKIGKTLYRVTSVYQGKIELSRALEDLTVQKILQAKNALRADT